ncbi:hypothetical protein PYCCODRAFT_1429093 [Trametes coccinea BRFM310]|uniref:Uncharacterized protein n=1 Tax=Trametes coccinea (strain BRFM310) TaxID=1353009 RepID=A0A1Y2I5M1_TRAC3|nr:hypothetical protein PYCCODRAFT_1429093 [Trametes coccinea BRFM310]
MVGGIQEFHLSVGLSLRAVSLPTTVPTMVRSSKRSPYGHSPRCQPLHVANSWTFKAHPSLTLAPLSCKGTKSSGSESVEAQFAISGRKLLQLYRDAVIWHVKDSGIPMESLELRMTQGGCFGSSGAAGEEKVDTLFDMAKFTSPTALRDLQFNPVNLEEPALLVIGWSHVIGAFVLFVASLWVRMGSSASATQSRSVNMIAAMPSTVDVPKPSAVQERDDLDELTLRYAEGVVALVNNKLRKVHKLVGHYHGALVLSGDQYPALDEAVRGALQLAVSLEDQWYLFSHLYDRLLMSMGTSDAARYQDIAPMVEDAHQFIQDTAAELKDIVDEWDPYFATLLTMDGLSAVLNSVEGRMLDVSIVESAVQRDFDYIIACMRKRDEVTVDIQGICSLKEREWTESGYDVVPVGDVEEIATTIEGMAREYVLQRALLPLALQNIKDAYVQYMGHGGTVTTAGGEAIILENVSHVLDKRDMISELASDIQSVGVPMLHILRVLVGRLRRIDDVEAED